MCWAGTNPLTTLVRHNVHTPFVRPLFDELAFVLQKRSDRGLGNPSRSCTLPTVHSVLHVKSLEMCWMLAVAFCAFLQSACQLVKNLKVVYKNLHFGGGGLPLSNVRCQDCETAAYPLRIVP